MRGKGFCVLFLSALLCLRAGCGGMGAALARPASPPPAAAVAPVFTRAPIPARTFVPTAIPVLTAIPVPTAIPAPTPFTVVWFGDTQGLAGLGDGGAQLLGMSRWVLDHRAERNIVAAVHVGDLCDVIESPQQFALADEMTAAFIGELPFCAVGGNHDGHLMRQYRYDRYHTFRFIGATPPERLYHGGDGMVLELTAGGVPLLIVGMSYGITDAAAMDWMRQQFAARPDSVGILLTHCYINARALLMEQSYPLEQVVHDCPNVRMVLCGHCSGEYARRVDSYDDNGDGAPERAVQVMMFDYQAIPGPTFDYLRLMTFDPVTRDVSIDTYAPSADDYIWNDDAPDAERFVLTDAF